MFSAPRRSACGEGQVLGDADDDGVGQAGGLGVNLRTDVAQTRCRSTGRYEDDLLPREVLEDTSLRSVLVSLESGACSAAGSVPTEWMGCL